VILSDQVLVCALIYCTLRSLSIGPFPQPRLLDGRTILIVMDDMPIASVGRFGHLAETPPAGAAHGGGNQSSPGCNTAVGCRLRSFTQPYQPSPKGLSVDQQDIDISSLERTCCSDACKSRTDYQNTFAPAGSIRKGRLFRRKAENCAHLFARGLLSFECCKIRMNHNFVGTRGSRGQFLEKLGPDDGTEKGEVIFTMCLLVSHLLQGRAGAVPTAVE
jgi:hypothetical protein